MKIGYKIDWSTQPLGRLPDAQIAKRLGCGYSVVRTARMNLGILPWGRRKKPGMVTDKERYRRNRTRLRAQQRAAYAALTPEEKKKRFAQSQAWYKAHPEKKRVQLRKRKYGLDEAAFTALLAAQGNVCALCKQPGHIADDKGAPDGFVVDHDHETNIVRGILHRRCNLGIGLFDDDLNRLRAAVDYLANHTKEWTNAH